MFSNDSAEVRGVSPTALSLLCQFQLNWENSFALSPCREVFQQRPRDSRKSFRPGQGQGKASGQGGKGRPPPWLLAAQLSPSCPVAQDQPFPARLGSGAGTQRRHLPDLYPTSLSQHHQDVTLPPACYFTIINLLLNQDNTTIKNNIVITCSTTNKFCIEPEQHISITNSSISIF